MVRLTGMISMGGWVIGQAFISGYGQIQERDRS